MNEQLQPHLRFASRSRRIVTNGAAVHRDQTFEAIAPIWRGGQTQPTSHGYLSHAAFERDSWNVVALVDDDESVTGGHVLEVVSSRETLCHCDIDDAALTIVPVAELSDLVFRQSEVSPESVTPLVDERLAIDYHQRWAITVSD